MCWLVVEAEVEAAVQLEVRANVVRVVPDVEETEESDELRDGGSRPCSCKRCLILLISVVCLWQYTPSWIVGSHSAFHSSRRLACCHRGSAGEYFASPRPPTRTARFRKRVVASQLSQAQRYLQLDELDELDGDAGPRPGLSSAGSGAEEEPRVGGFVAQATRSLCVETANKRGDWREVFAWRSAPA